MWPPGYEKSPTQEDYSSKFLKVVRVREVPSSNLGTPTVDHTASLFWASRVVLSRLRIRGLETADHKALIREILSSAVPAGVIDHSHAHELSILNYPNSDHSNKRQVVRTICRKQKRIQSPAC